MKIFNYVLLGILLSGMIISCSPDAVIEESLPQENNTTNSYTNTIASDTGEEADDPSDPDDDDGDDGDDGDN